MVYNHKQKVDNKTYKNISKKNKKLASVILILLVITGLILGGFYYKNRNSDKSLNNDQTINYEPATKEEKKQAEDNKDRIVKEQQESNDNPTPSDPNNKISVTPTITNTTGSVNAYISGIFEEGGECTAIFTKRQTTLTKSSVGFENVSYTQCAPMTLENGFLSPGSWEIKVKYLSSTAEGTSASQSIEVQ